MENGICHDIGCECRDYILPSTFESNKCQSSYRNTAEMQNEQELFDIDW